MVSYSAGTYTVAGSHTYTDEGSYSISIGVLDDGGQTTTITGTATVADAALTGSSAATAGGTEGAVNSSVLAGATFTDANPGNHTADFTATIDWGDGGPTSLGTVSYSAGTYTVAGSHTYADEGSYPISIGVLDDGGSTATITGTATVADAALTGSAAATAGGTEGATNSSVLAGATFTDANPGDHTADFTATITWGDGGGTSAGVVSYSAGTYTVAGSHTYAEEGSYSISISVLDDGGSTTTITGTATVADAALTGSAAATAGGTEGATNSSVLAGATFTDANPGNHTADFTATITWGDGGATSAGVVSYSAGTYTVAGSHTYADEGSYPISISILDDGGQTATITGTATVADAALTGSAAATAGGTEGATNSSVLAGATFTDANPGDHTADFTATITWGDGGPTSLGTVSYSTGTYTVAGSHTYAEEGSYSISISVLDDGGSTTTITGTATVADAALTGSSVTTAGGTEGATNSSVLVGATFTDANPGNHTADFTATITWGDGGATSTGVVSYSAGTYTVAGSHTYADEGSYSISISVLDDGGSTATITGTATVADAALTGSSAATAGGTEGATNSSVLAGATFTDANPGDHTADFTATITWGDGGGTSAGVVSYSAGTYTVAGSHTYTDEGSYSISISVLDDGGSTATITGTATVADAALTGSSAATAGGTEGATNSSVLAGATFTDANPGNNTADFTAMIDWGDGGPTSLGTVSYSAGVYTVAGSHTYAEEGSYSISIGVLDDGGSTATITGTATVADAGLTGSSAATAGGTEGATNSSVLAGATFTDANPGNNTADFTAMIDWGDGGPTSLGTVSYSAGVYTVAGSHTYAEEGSYSISIGVLDDGGSTATITGTATVADAGLTGSSAATAGGTEGATNSSVLAGATFTDANPGNHTADFTATIAWGDGGATSLGTVSYSAGVYTVAGSHTYAEEGSYSISIGVLDDGGSTATITGTATVADAGLTGSSAATAGGTEGATNSSVLAGATFTDANPGNHTADFTATITWGDGGATSAGVVSYSAGVYTVSGSHTYADEGSYAISISVLDDGGSTTTITGTATVADAGLTGSSAATAGGTEGATNSSVLAGATFTDANPGDHTADFTATITWGDGGPTSLGTVSYRAGTYTVAGSHTYADEGATRSASAYWTTAAARPRSRARRRWPTRP